MDVGSPHDDRFSADALNLSVENAHWPDAGVYLESNGGGTAAQRANIGTLMGTGGWETYSSSLSDIPNAEALRAKLNVTSPKVTKLTGTYAGVNFADGEAVQIDALNIYYEAPGTQVEENPAVTFGSSGGASRTRTIDGAGAVSDATVGTPNFNVALNSDPALRGFAFEVKEDGSVGAGNNGSTGFLRCAVTDAADTGGPWGFSVPGLKVFNWTPGSITVPNLADISVNVGVKIPAGVTLQLYAEPVGGSAGNRADLGAITGNGTWQSVTREFATAGNVEAFRAALNAATTTSFQLTFACPNNAPAGDILAIDDAVVLRWRSYSVGGPNARLLM